MERLLVVFWWLPGLREALRMRKTKRGHEDDEVTGGVP